MERSVTALLTDWRAGDASAGDALIARLYDELHALAARHLRRERADHTLRPTDLVSEAYLRLAEGAQPSWVDRAHFFAVAARAMRHVLVDHQRRRMTAKRDAGVRPLALDGLEGVISVERPPEVVALDDALDELAKLDERKARAIEMSYFGGLSQAEIAEVLGVHANTVAADLKLAQAWLHRRLQQ